MFRVIREFKPNWVIAENVNGFVNMGLSDVLNDLESEGFESQAFIIPACAVGAPHERKRVWIVAYSKGNRSKGESREIQGENESKKTERQEKRIWKSNATSFFSDSRCKRNTRDEEDRNDSGTPRKGDAFEFERPDQTILYSKREGLQGPNESKLESRNTSRSSWWPVESEFCRVDDGIPRELDSNLKQFQKEFTKGYVTKEKIPNRANRIKGLGNAVVPQIPYIIGKYIMEIENANK